MPVPQYDENQTKGYRIFLTGIKGVIRILILVFIVVIAIFLIRAAYRIGYEVTGTKPLDSGENAKESMVVISKEMSPKDIADLLIEKGLIDEDPYAFVLQERLSEYHDEIVPGTYVLNTSMTVDDMLRIMARADDKEEEENDS